MTSPQDFIQTCLDVTGSMFVLIDRNRRVALINERGCQILRGRREDIVGKDWFHFVLEDHRPEAVQRFHTLLEGAQASPQSVELPARTVLGEVRTLIWHEAALKNEAGQVVGMLCSGEDVTEQRRMEEALRASERFLDSTLNALSAHIAVLDEHGEIIAVNEAWRQFARAQGTDPTTVSEGTNYLTVCEQARGLDADVAAEAAAGIRAVIEGTRSMFSLEYPCHSPTEEHWFVMHASRFASEGPVRTVVAHEDITERKQVEDALRTSEERFRLALEHSPIVVYHTDRELRYTWIYNLRHGFTPEEIIGKRDDELLPAADVAELIRFKQEVLNEGRRMRREIHIQFPGGYALYDATAEPLRDAENRITGLTVAALDITERRHMERQILEISNKEQRRIGQDLHDALGSHLTGVAMLARGLARSLHRGHSVEAEALEEIATLVREGAEQARALARGLHPIKLDKQGLVPALQELADDMQTFSGIPCTFEATLQMPDLSSEVTTQLYRIVQGAVMNAIKHADASHIQIRLFLQDKQLVLEIEDDGIGIRETEPTQGSGLDIMRYRARIIEAALHTDTAPDGGTLVSCSLPV